MALARRPRRGTPSTTHRASGCWSGSQGKTDFYGGVVVGAQTIGVRATEPTLVSAVDEELRALEPDEYLEYVACFLRAGRLRAGDGWRYADITTVLAAAAELLAPRSYLEIGVRRGRSMAVVGRRAPDCAIVGIDLWNEGYAGMENPGAEHVRGELARVGYVGPLRLISGDSHVELRRLFAAEPELSFDLVTVDGDHSEKGARRDLEDVLPRLRIGGALVFDDMSHASHPYLERVWRETIAADRRYATWSYDDVGYGVAVAVRRW